jgi:hypothetical protein
MHPNYDETRRMFETHTLAALAQHHSPEEMKAVEPLIKEHIATTYTDEVLFRDFQRIVAEKRAKDLAYAEQLAAEQKAKATAIAVTRRHTSELAEANKVAMTYQGRAEAAEAKAKGLEAQVNGLLRGQRS